jgi:ribonuclease D
MVTASTKLTARIHSISTRQRMNHYNAAMTVTNNDIVHVTQDAQLPDALALLAPSPFLVVDTEFLRERTYFAKLCLVQLATESVVVVMDVLALSTIEPLLDFIYQSQRLKIFHSGRQDLEVLSQALTKLNPSASNVIPGPIFDTQIAAALTGLPAQIGYADLVHRKLGVKLSKELTRTDWSRRPLSHEQVLYAADDVRYLVPLYHHMRKELEQRGRLGWLEEECASLQDGELYRTLPEDAWQRLKGAQQLEPEQRAALKSLAAWRETRAIKKDKPRGWILSDESLRHLSESLPTTVEQLTQIRDMAEGTATRKGEELLQLILESKARAANESPANDFRPTPQQQSHASRLMRKMRLIAEDKEIAPELLMPRRYIEQLVYFDKRKMLEQGWRYEVVGKPLLQEWEKIQQGK